METQVFKAFDQTRSVFRIRWNVANRRKSIAWGSDEQDAETCRSHVEHLIDCQGNGRPIQNVTLQWLDRLSDRNHRKLSGKGLIEQRQEKADEPTEPQIVVPQVTIEKVTTAFLKAHSSAKLSTAAKWKQAVSNLHLHFGAAADAMAISKQDAKEFREWLLAKGNVRDTKGGNKKKGDDTEARTELDRNTVGRRIGICRQIFKWAIEEAGMRSDNPFNGLPASVHVNPDRFHYIDERTTHRVIKYANDPNIRAIFALNRLIGLRLPSEIQTLRWCDIDLSDEDPHLRILAPKTEHHANRGRRTAPIIPNLRPFLEDIWTIAEPGLKTPLDAPVFPRFQAATGAAIRSAVLKVLKRADIETWPNLFSNGRKSAITDLLQDGHDVVDVAGWVGNSPKVVWEFYAMQRSENRRRAAGGGRADGRRTATQTGKHAPESPSELWTYLWTHQGSSRPIRTTNSECGPKKNQRFTGFDEEKWAVRDSNPDPLGVNEVL